MSRAVAVLSTLDTKGRETEYLREQIERQGATAVVMDLGVIGTPATRADVTREDVARAGGHELATLLRTPTRHEAGPVMVRGAIALLGEMIERDAVHGVVGLGGTQGTTTCSAVMRALPYGFPKVLVSTIASGDTSAFVDVKDVTMMFSVGDLLGLNVVSRKILANAAGAVVGMTRVPVALDRTPSDRPLIGMTNLGVLTEGAMVALGTFEAAGYEVIVFHAVGSGGRAMEQMMKDGLIGAVFDYALGEITDAVFDGLRAADAERLTVAGALGLPQVLCPGGAEHVGLLVAPDTVPEAYRDHLHVFHSPVILAPRLRGTELERVAAEIGRRLASTRGRACFMIPTRGSSRYAIAGGPLHDPAGDAAFWAALRASLPPAIELVERDTHAEDPAFVREAAERLIGLIEQDG